MNYKLLLILFLIFNFPLIVLSNEIKTGCGLQGSLNDRIADCDRFHNLDDIKFYTEKKYDVYTVTKVGAIFFTDKKRKWGYSPAVDNHSDCIAPYKPITKRRMRILKKSGINTPENKWRCRAKIKKLLLVPQSRKELFREN
jgi:hypothetical protein